MLPTAAVPEPRSPFAPRRGDPRAQGRGILTSWSKFVHGPLLGRGCQLRSARRALSHRVLVRENTALGSSFSLFFVCGCFFLDISYDFAKDP